MTRWGMVASLLLAAAACVQPLPPPVQPSWPTLEPSPPPPTMTSDDDTANEPQTPAAFQGLPVSHQTPLPAAMPGYNSHVVALRTSLGRSAIDLEMQTPDTYSIRMSACDDKRVDCYVCTLAGETDPLDAAVLVAVKRAIDRYPTEVLAATHIERVALCRGLTRNGEVDRTTIGTVDLGTRRLVISLAPFIGEATYDADKHGTSTTEDIVHHELFHLFEYERMRPQFDSDAEWSKLNPLGFVYGTHTEEDGTRRDGFVNAYARTNEVEDKASVYQLMMAHPDQLCGIEKADPIVRAKVAVLWQRIAAITDDAYLRRRALCGAN